jgi:6-phosphogluconolactonase
MRGNVKGFSSLEKLSGAAAEIIVQWAHRCVQQRGAFHWVLAGGSTPLRLYECMASSPWVERMPWEDTHLYWGDERWVPWDHPESNYGTAQRTWIDSVPIPPSQIHPIPTDLPEPEAAAAAYEETLRRTLDARGDVPAFDCLLLGLGRDGHIASLFPGDSALQERRRWVTSVNEPRGEPRVPRITLTLPIIQRARLILVLVSGSGKGEIWNRLLRSSGEEEGAPPASLLRPEGKLFWMLDWGGLE